MKPGFSLISHINTTTFQKNVIKKKAKFALSTGQIGRNYFKDMDRHEALDVLAPIQHKRSHTHDIHTKKKASPLPS